MTVWQLEINVWQMNVSFSAKEETLRGAEEKRTEGKREHGKVFIHSQNIAHVT